MVILVALCFWPTKTLKTWKMKNKWHSWNLCTQIIFRVILFAPIMWWLEQGFNQLEDSPRQGLVPPVHMACPVWHHGDLRIEPREAAVWCSRWAPVVAMEITNTAETQRKGTCRSSGACLKMNEKQAEFRIGPQLVVPHGVLISFPFLFLFLFQRVDWKQGCVLKNAQSPPTSSQPGISLEEMYINDGAWLIRLGVAAREARAGPSGAHVPLVTGV